MNKTISVKKETKIALENLGKKGETFDDIINMILHQRNILLIHDICGTTESENLKENCEIIFKEIGFTNPAPFIDYDENGEEFLNEWDSFTDALNWAVDMATDEDLIGANATNDERKLLLAEAVTNVYCLMQGIQAPTWKGFGLKNPFSKNLN